MDTSAVAPFCSYNGHINNFSMKELNFSSNLSNACLNHDESTRDLEPASSDTSNSPTSCAYDEDFVVNDEEDVRTPRSSPTLKELHRFLANADVRPSPNISSVSTASSPDSKSKTPSSCKSLSAVSAKPCPYPLDHLFDETVPVQPRRWIKDTIKRTADICSFIDKVPISPRSFASHPPVRPLESITLSPTSPLPRMMSYSASGYLLGRLSDMPFQTDLLLGDKNFLRHERATIDEAQSKAESMEAEVCPTANAPSYGNLDDLIVSASASIDTGLENNCVLDDDQQKNQSNPIPPETLDDAVRPTHQLHVTVKSDAEISSTASETSSRLRRSTKKKIKKSKSQIKPNPPSQQVEDLSAVITLLHSTQDNSEEPNTTNVDREPSPGQPDTSLVNGNHVTYEDGQSATRLTVDMGPDFQQTEDPGVPDEDFTLVVNKKQRRKQRQNLDDITPVELNKYPRPIGSAVMNHPPIVPGQNDPCPRYSAPSRPIQPHFFDRSKQQPPFTRSLHASSASFTSYPSRGFNSHRAVLPRSLNNPPPAANSSFLSAKHCNLSRPPYTLTLNSRLQTGQHQRLINFLSYTWNAFCAEVK